MSARTPFPDRRRAGELLGAAIAGTGHPIDVVLALPRGGLPVAEGVAERLRRPLDVLVVRKLGVPHQRELAMGAISEGDVEVLNDSLRRRLGVADADLDAVRRDERAVLDERLRTYRSVRPAVPIEGQDVLIVDDGVATGATMHAAIEVVRARGARSVVVAAPVASPASARELEELADEVVVLETPTGFAAVGQAYVDFGQTSDTEVIEILERAAAG